MARRRGTNHHRTLSPKQAVEMRRRVVEGDLRGRSPKVAGHHYDCSPAEAAMALAGTGIYADYPKDYAITDRDYLTYNIPLTESKTEHRLVGGGAREEAMRGKREPKVLPAEQELVRSDWLHTEMTTEEIAEFRHMSPSTVKKIVYSVKPYDQYESLKGARPMGPRRHRTVEIQERVELVEEPTPLPHTVPGLAVHTNGVGPLELIQSMLRAVGPRSLGWVQLPEGAAKLSEIVGTLREAHELQGLALKELEIWVEAFESHQEGEDVSGVQTT